MDGGLTILVVDDSAAIRELYAEWLEDENDIETARDGDEALEQIDEGFDLVLLDREMPGPNGREVAVEMETAGYDVHVVMVSSLPADFDIVEYPVDGYLQKPATADDITGIVERYVSQQSYQQALEEYFGLTSKLAAVEAELSDEKLEASDEYDRLIRLVGEKRAEVDEAISESSAGWDFAFKACGRAAGTTESNYEVGPPNM